MFKIFVWNVINQKNFHMIFCLITFYQSQYPELPLYIEIITHTIFDINFFQVPLTLITFFTLIYIKVLKLVVFDEIWQ